MTNKTVPLRMWEPIGTARVRTTDSSPQRAITRTRMISPTEAVAMLQRSIDKIRTTDAAPASRWLSWKGRGRFRDTLVSAEPTSKNPAMLGRVWEGDLVAQLDALSTADRKVALDAMRRVLDDYAQGAERGLMRPGNSGSLATVGDEPYVGSGAEPGNINDANKKFWDDMASNNLASRDSTPPRDATGVQIQSMQRANDAYWKAATAYQRTPPKEWGKG